MNFKQNLFLSLEMGYSRNKFCIFYLELSYAGQGGIVLGVQGNLTLPLYSFHHDCMHYLFIRCIICMSRITKYMNNCTCFQKNTRTRLMTTQGQNVRRSSTFLKPAFGLCFLHEKRILLLHLFSFFFFLATAETFYQMAFARSV